MQLLRRPKAVFGIAVIVLLYGGGVLAPLLAPYGFDDQDLLAARQGPSAAHLLGTDFVGRDVLSRVIYSLRTNLIVTATAVATGSLALGITLGLAAGYFGRRTDTVIMRVGEVFLAFPGLLLVILLAATVRPPRARLGAGAGGRDGRLRAGAVGRRRLHRGLRRAGGVQLGGRRAAGAGAGHRAQGDAVRGGVADDGGDGAPGSSCGTCCRTRCRR